MADAKLTPEIEAVLRASTITGNQLVLPAGRLERKLYEAVSKVIVNAGGKWNKSAKAHIFDRDPRVKLNLALETGVAIDEKKKLQAFYTPQELAHRVALLADVHGCIILEPSAGDGALAEACMKLGAARVDCFEINAGAAKILDSKGFSCGCIDFLSVNPNSNFHYDRIVMNPPFTKKQDIKHVEHAMKFLAKGGKLTAVMQPNHAHEIAASLHGSRYVEIQGIDAGAFKKSGTTIATAIITIR